MYKVIVENDAGKCESKPFESRDEAKRFAEDMKSALGIAGTNRGNGVKIKKVKE